MELTETFSCAHCGDRSDHTITPDGSDPEPISFTLVKTCHGSCAPETSTLTPEQVHKLTGHSWHPTGKWTRLASASVDGWVP